VRGVGRRTVSPRHDVLAPGSGVRDCDGSGRTRSNGGLFGTTRVRVQVRASRASGSGAPPRRGALLVADARSGGWDKNPRACWRRKNTGCHVNQRRAFCCIDSPRFDEALRKQDHPLRAALCNSILDGPGHPPVPVPSFNRRQALPRWVRRLRGPSSCGSRLQLPKPTERRGTQHGCSPAPTQSPVKWAIP
jgi:hypothetical protein